METGETYNIIFIDDKGHLFGRADYTRLENAKWYQKLWAKVNSRYKQSLIDVQPLESNYKGNGTYGITV